MPHEVRVNEELGAFRYRLFFRPTQRLRACGCVDRVCVSGIPASDTCAPHLIRCHEWEYVTPAFEAFVPPDPELELELNLSPPPVFFDRYYALVMDYAVQDEPRNTTELMVYLRGTLEVCRWSDERVSFGRIKAMGSARDSSLHVCGSSRD